MSFRPERVQPEFNDLITSLSNSRNQIRDNPLYQTIFLLIKRLTVSKDLTQTQIKDLDETLDNVLAASFLTVDDESNLLVNSRKEIAGPGITLDDTVPHIRKISSSGGGVVIGGNTTPILLNDVEQDIPYPIEFFGTIDNKGLFTYVTSTVTGTQNDLYLGVVGNIYCEWSGASDVTITGITGGSFGKVLIFKNTGTKVAYFSQNSGSSSASNRFKNLVTSSTTPVAPNGWITYIHNGTNYILTGHEQGANIIPSFSAGDWSGGSMTVTVDSGDVLTDAYRIVGKTFHYWFFLNTITIGGTLGPQIFRTIPNSYAFTSGGTGSGGPMRVYDNGTYRTGFAFVYTPSSSTQIVFTIQDLSNYAASTNNSGLFGYITFEVD